MNTTDSDDVIIRRTLDTDQDAPASQIVELVADLEGREPTDLPPIYYNVDELIADLFSSPPRAEAEASLEFTYEGYQFRVKQNGVTTVSNQTRPAPG
ncbi:HalOD1 output domain-containing protein [Natronococcus wangiae]|uniref:HalOD1 output domain-containing protein n=1 Tax=Natronococcus wangiae TaxID=3068275 RepID=UPI00273E02AE|nr:HalOD1 output domain-containing protein [Natronococcus sp. AD5]